MSSTDGAKIRSWQMAPQSPSVATATQLLHAVCLALGITLLQTAVVLMLAALTRPAEQGGLYAALCQWDGRLYALIVQDGYRSAIPPTPLADFAGSNVGFFPGYPLAASVLRQLSGNTLSAQASLVLTAQLAAWGFWTYWLLFLARFRVRRPLAMCATLAVALHPAAFFLVVAYSESLFLCATLGFFYWLGADREKRGWAVPHGILMSATRLGGLPVAWVPLAAQLLCAMTRADDRQSLAGKQRAKINAERLWQDRAALGRLVLVAAAASLGGVAFFAFCQARFGYWNLYFWTQQTGATVAADWLWWLKPGNYAFFGSLLFEHIPWTNDLSRLLVALTVVALFAVVRFERQRAAAGDRTLPERLPFYLAAGGLFFLHAAGVSSLLMQSMLRYVLVVHVLLLLGLLQAWRDGGLPAWLQSVPMRRRIGIVALLAGLQLLLIWCYFTHRWVA